MPWCKDSCRFISCALKCPGYPPLWIDDQISPHLHWIVGRGLLQPRGDCPAPGVCDVNKLSQRNKRPYVAGIYYYPPRRGGSVADRWDRVCLPEQDWAAGVETDSLLGVGIGDCGQYRRGGGG